MNAYSFILAVILLSEAKALEEREEYYHVGTVLFSPIDTNKKHWTNAEIGLLRARKQFLQIIPPPHLLNPRNDDFADSILEYFKETYATVKKEAPDIETGNLLMTALSDTIGGHMKMWTLPIIKLSYYGGKVRKDAAVRLYQFHEDIKIYLDTDGSSWHEPNMDSLKSMSIDIAPRKEYSRDAKDPCQALAYFEKTNSGLIIPIPKVNWVKGSEVMFVPLRNHSIVSLNSPNSSNILFKYYDIAKRCIETSNIDSEDKYDNRLQNWLLVDIIPHLTDEKLYPALRSVLSLVNTTLAKNLGDTVVRYYTAEPIKKTLKKPTNNTFKKKTCVPVDLTSKKMMIVSIIILIEIAWCIPTLCYLMCTRMKKRITQSKNNVYFYIEPKNSKSKRCCGWTESTQGTMTEMIVENDQFTSSRASMKSTGIGQSPRTRSFNVVTSCPLDADGQNKSIHSVGICTRSNVKCQINRICDDVIDQATNNRAFSKKNVEMMAIPDKRSTATFNIVKRESNRSISFDKASESQTASYITVQEIKKSKKSKKSLIEKKSSLKTEIISFVDETRKVANPSNKKISKRLKNHTSIPIIPDNKNNSKVEPSSSSKLCHDVRIEKVIKTILKPTDAHQKNDVIVNKKVLKHKTDKPYLEIIIDRPPREISVGIVDNSKMGKPSKIPKRFFNNCNTQTQAEKKEKEVCKRIDVGRSLIPQPKKQNALDDIAVVGKKPVKDNLKLNVTL